MQIDYHTHHNRCGHASGTLEQYVRQAVDKGLDQLGLSDHMPLIHVNPEEYLPEMAMPMEELPRYVEECFELREKYKDRIEIRVGLEGDYIEGFEDEIGKIVNGYDWDYVIGSVHFLGTWDITDHRQLDRWEGRDVGEVYRRYYDAVKKAARTGFYDFIGHFDVIKRFGRVPEEDPAPWEEEALDEISRQGIAIELNASGLGMPARDMFPGWRILREARKRNIPVTLGSDAHRPEHVGKGLDEARKRLREAGYAQLATFRQRKRIMVDLV